MTSCKSIAMASASANAAERIQKRDCMGLMRYRLLPTNIRKSGMSWKLPFKG